MWHFDWATRYYDYMHIKDVKKLRCSNDLMLAN